MTFTPSAQHTVEAFELACQQLEDLSGGYSLFSVLNAPSSFPDEVLELAEYLDSWDCWLYTDESIQLLGA